MTEYERTHGSRTHNQKNMKKMNAPGMGESHQNQDSAPSGREGNSHSHNRRIMNQDKEVMVCDQFHKNNRTVSKPLRSIKRTENTNKTVIRAYW